MSAPPRRRGPLLALLVAFAPSCGLLPDEEPVPPQSQDEAVLEENVTGPDGEFDPSLLLESEDESLVPNRAVEGASYESGPVADGTWYSEDLSRDSRQKLEQSSNPPVEDPRGGEPFEAEFIDVGIEAALLVVVAAVLTLLAKLVQVAGRKLLPGGSGTNGRRLARVSAR